MINVNYNSPGNYNFNVPFGVLSMRGVVIGGGGGGFRDDDNDRQGGGGGGGAWVSAGPARPVSSGQNISIRVGSGGSINNSGGSSFISGWSGLTIQANGGGRGTDDNGGGGGGGGQFGPGDSVRNGRSGGDDDGNPDGVGGGAGRCPRGTSDNQGGQGIGYSGNCQGPAGTNGGTMGGGGAGNKIEIDFSTFQTTEAPAGRGGRGGARLIYNFTPPSISFFTSTTQTSANGNPSSNVTFQWGVTLANAVRIRADSSSGPIVATGLGTASTGNSTTINTGLQSTAGSNSPATRTYVLEARNTIASPTLRTFASTTARVFNDNNPGGKTLGNGIPIGNSSGGTKTASGNNILDAESDRDYYSRVDWGNTTDMPCRCNVVSGVGTRLSLNASSWTTSQILVPTTQKFIFVRYTSAPFNTSRTPGGTSGGFVVGQTTTRSYSISIGTDNYSFNCTTRAPRLEETFDAEGQPLSPNAYPNPDIDTVVPDLNQPYIFTQQININDSEIAVEVKTEDPDSQVSVNSSATWQNMRQIGTPPSS